MSVEMDESTLKEVLRSIKDDRNKSKWNQEILLKQIETVTASKLSPEIISRLSYQEIIDLKLIFDAFDIDHDNLLDCHEMQRALRALGYRLNYQFLQDLSVNDSSQFSFDEFLKFIINQSNDGREEFDEIAQAFDLFDYDKCGKITLANLRRAERECGLKYTDRELENMIDVADCDGDGQISKDEFMAIMLKTSMFLD